MRTRSIGLTLFTGLAVFVAACTGGGASNAPSSPASSAPSAAASAGESTAPGSAAPGSAAPSEGAAPTCDTKLKVGLVTDVGRVNDKGFNQSAYEGMLAAAEAAPTCFETDYIETTSQSDYAKNIAEFTDSGSDVVIGVGFLLGDALGDAAKANPEIKFISVDGAPNPGHDEAWPTAGESLFFAEAQAGYLAGVLAASISKTNHIGVVGGLQVVPPVERFVEGYINGAKATKPDITVDFVYTTSFTDPPQGKNAAQQMLDNGADIIFGAGGLTGNGALEAACGKAGALAIGVDTDQYLTLPSVQKCIVSSATKNIVEAVKSSLVRIAAGQFTPGFHVDNAATNGIGLAPFHDQEAAVPAEVKTLLDDTFKGLADGSIQTGADKPDGKTP
jgi:basic membrane protein A